MSASHTKRQMIIDENLPLLVKSLTGFNENDENFKLCETYAFSRIASHRFLSVNSHEVRRRIDGIAERFMADNYTQYGEKLKKLASEFVNDPLCTNHYEYDIQWSILHFLMEVSRNPVAALSEDKNCIKIDDSGHSEDIRIDRRSSTINDLVNSLIKHNIPSPRDANSKDAADESDLSDWSDEDGAGAVGDTSIVSQTTSVGSSHTDVMPLRLKLIPFAKDALRPPEKRSIFTEFDASKATEWREQNVQEPWWLTSTAPGNVTVISEWCLQREIIWMLQMQPFEAEIGSEQIVKFSKFFSLNMTTDEFIINPDVTLCSTSVDGLKPILTEFANVSTELYRFRKLFQTIFEPPAVNNFLESIQMAPYSIQSYAIGLKDFFRVMEQKICQLEIDLVKQNLTETHTIVHLYNELKIHFRRVHTLYNIHQRVYIDFKTNEGHVCTAYLFAGLIYEMDTAAMTDTLNMLTSLLLGSIRFYLSAFNSWWNEGRLTDHCSEFLIEKCSKPPRAANSTSNIHQRRSIADGISRALDATKIIEQIEDCEIVSLFREEGMEAGYILNILYNLDKLSEMKAQQTNVDCQDIEEAFMNSFWEEINKFHAIEPLEGVIGAIEHIDLSGCAANVQNNAKDENGVNIVKPNQPEKWNATKSSDEEETLLSKELMGGMDALLAMVFDQYASNTKVESAIAGSSTVGGSSEDGKAEDSLFEIDENPTNCYNLYKRISDVTDFPMPLSIVIHQCLEKILKSRISVANRCVLRIFLDEYKVLDHLINMQRVFFFGAGDLMLTFYSKLFQSMNSGEDWNNSYLLTVQLDDILSTRYPEMHSMFSVSISAPDSHIKETLSAINDITINYSVRDSIRDVIHESALTKYNEIFRFLLQVKWAIWTLETLRFPVSFKKRPPYQELTLIDLIFKRLALVRNWIIYSVQCIHSHLMTFVIQSMGQGLVTRMAKVECLRGIIQLHDSYIETIYQHCFRKTGDIFLKTGIEKLLSLVVVLRDEWNNLQNVNSHGDYVDGENQFDISGTVQQVDSIEETYINCHCNIAEILTKEVYTKEQDSLASLSAAFNCSCPY